MNSARINIIEVLQLIALKAEQIDLEEQAEQPISIPRVLLEMWEEVYQPDQPEFERGFAQAELEQLSRFTDFFQTRVNGRPTILSELFKDPYWNAVCEFAGEILEDFSKAAKDSAVKA